MGPRVAATVLVVEDEAEILHLMKQVLSRDFVVHTATSGEEALQILRSEKVHAVVSDHMLPEMTGVDLLRQVAQLQPDAARVLVTASTQVATAQDAINVARVRRFLTKPFRAQELLSTVGEAIHEVAVAQIKTELVRELKARNSELSRTMELFRARDSDLSDKLENIALRDAVTGLYIHRYFQEALSAELLRARAARRPLSLVMVDVHQFGHWNREYGFAEGDVLLQRLAELLDAGGVAARYGGGRFAVLLPNATSEDARGWAERIRAAAEQLGKGKELAGPFVLRLGAATFPDEAQDEAELIDAAVRALR